jgi:hypothetical protein
MMLTGIRLAAALSAVLLVTSCAAHGVRIADLRDRPGRYDEKTIRVTGVVTSSWGVPLLPIQVYNISDGSGEIPVISRSGRVPSKGAHVTVKGRLNDIASLGSRSVGLHIEERDRDID